VRAHLTFKAQSDSHLERPKEIHGACAAALRTGARWALSAPRPDLRPPPHAMRRSRPVATATSGGPRILEQSMPMARKYIDFR
jgi:hypothetical protein